MTPGLPRGTFLVSLICGNLAVIFANLKQVLRPNATIGRMQFCLKNAYTRKNVYKQNIR